MVTFDDCECVSRLLSNTISMLCRNALKFNKELRVEGILGVTLDSDVIFLVRVNETIDALSRDSNDTSGASTNTASTSKGQLPCRPPAARRLALMPRPVSPAPEISPERSSTALAWPLKSSSVSATGQMASPPVARVSHRPGNALVPKGRFLPVTGPRFSLGRPRLMGSGTRPRGIQATGRMGLRQRMSVPRASMQQRLPMGARSSTPRPMGLGTGNRLIPKGQPARLMLKGQAPLAVRSSQPTPRRPTPQQGRLAIEQSPRTQGKGPIPCQMEQSPKNQGNLQGQLAIPQSPRLQGPGNVQGQLAIPQSPRLQGPGNVQGQLAIPQSPRLQGPGNVQGQLVIPQSPRLQGQGSMRGQLAIPQSPRLQGQGNVQGQLSIPQSPRLQGQGNVRGQLAISQSPRLQGQGNVRGQLVISQSPRHQGHGNVQGQLAVSQPQRYQGQGSMQAQLAIPMSPRHKDQGNIQGRLAIPQSPRHQGQGDVPAHIFISQSPRQLMSTMQSPRHQITSSQSPRCPGQLVIEQSPRFDSQGNMHTVIPQSPRSQGNMREIPIVQSPRGQGDGNLQGQIPITQLPTEHQDLSQLLREVANSQLSRLFEGQNVKQMAVDQISSEATQASKPGEPMVHRHVQLGCQSVEPQRFQKPVVNVASRPILAVSQPPLPYHLMTHMSPGLDRVSPSQLIVSGVWSPPASMTSLQMRPVAAGTIGSNVCSTQQLQHTLPSNPAAPFGPLSTMNAPPVLSRPSFHGISRQPLSVFQSSSPPSFRQVTPNLHSQSSALGLKSYHHQSNAEPLRLALPPDYQHCQPVKMQSSIRAQTPLQTRPLIAQQPDWQRQQISTRPQINPVTPSRFDHVVAQQVLKSPVDHLKVAPNSSRLPQQNSQPAPVLTELLSMPGFCSNQNKDTETFVQQLHQLNASEDQYEGWINHFMAKQISPPAQPGQNRPQNNESRIISEATSQQQLCGQMVSSQSDGLTEMSGELSVGKSMTDTTSTSRSSKFAISCPSTLLSHSAGCSTPEEHVSHSVEKELNAFHRQIDPDEESQSSDSTVISGWCDLELDLEPETNFELVMSDSSMSCPGGKTNLASKLTSQSATVVGGTMSLDVGTVVRKVSSCSDVKNTFACKASGCNESFMLPNQLSSHYVDSHECNWGPPKDRQGRRIYQQWMLQQSKNTARTSGLNCDQCNRKFFSSHGLRRHQKTIHKKVYQRRKHDMNIV